MRVQWKEESGNTLCFAFNSYQLVLMSSLREKAILTDYIRACWTVVPRIRFVKFSFANAATQGHGVAFLFDSFKIIPRQNDVIVIFKQEVGIRKSSRCYSTQSQMKVSLPLLPCTLAGPQHFPHFPCFAPFPPCPLPSSPYLLLSALRFCVCCSLCCCGLS